MEIISFFSFKGGVGRTALVVNLGALWALRGKTVVMIDLDLAAPGFRSLKGIGPWLDPEWDGCGISYALDRFFRTSKDPKEPFELVAPSSLLRRCDPPGGQGWRGPGGLYAIDAGDTSFLRPQSDAETFPKSIPPREGGRNESRADVSLRSLAEAWRKDLEAWRTPGGQPIDYVLIDSRTGFPEIMDLTLGYLADRMIVVTGMNQQHRDGLRTTLQALARERVPLGGFASTITVVVSPVPTDGIVEARGLRAVRATIEECLRPLAHGIHESAPEILAIPYSSNVAVEDPPFPAILEGDETAYAKAIGAVGDHLRRPAPDTRRLMQEIVEETNRPAKPVETEKSEPRRTSRLRVNPFLDLPSWDWPLRALGWDDERIAGRKRELLGEHPNTEFDEDRYLTLWCLDIYWKADKKKQHLQNTPKYSIDQIERASNIISEEISKFSGFGDIVGFIGGMAETQRQWVGVVVPDGEEAAIHVFTAQVEGAELFPSWETWPEYWVSLAEHVRFEWRMDGLAERACQRAIELDRSFVDAWVKRGASLINLPGGADEAGRCLRQAFRLDPACAEAWVVLGWLRFVTDGPTAEARSALETGLALDPGEWSWAWGVRGVELQWAGQPAAALRSYARRQWITDDGWGRFQMAQLRKALGRTAKAGGDLALSLTRLGSDEWYGRGCAAALLGDDAEFERCLSTAHRRLAANRNRASAAEIILLGACLRNGDLSAADDAVAVHAPHPYAIIGCLYGCYQLAGWRPEARDNARRAARWLLERFEARRIEWGLMEGWDDAVRLYRTFADGGSDGAGDPRDLWYFDRDGSAASIP